MKSIIIKAGTIVTALFILSFTLFEHNAEARAGGGRSYGGSRSYSRPAAPAYQQPSQPRQQAAPPAGSFQQPQSGGFMRNMAGGMLGGMLGSMLFSGSAGAGAGSGTGGDGMGFFEIMLLAGVGYLIYRYIKKKRADNAAGLR